MFACFREINVLKMETEILHKQRLTTYIFGMDKDRRKM